MEKSTKKSTAALSDGSTNPICSISDIAALGKGIKKIEGWTLAPALPAKKNDWYLTLRAFRTEYGEIVTYYMVNYYIYPDTFMEGLIAWRPAPKIPKWAGKIAEGMIKGGKI